MRFYEQICHRLLAARRTVVGWLSDLGEAVRCPGVSLVVRSLWHGGGDGAFVRQLVGKSYWRNRPQHRNPSVRAVPFRLAPLRIYAVAVLHAGTARWASTRHSRWGRTKGSSRELCLRLKHEQNAWLASWLSELLVEARHDAFSGLPADTLVVPVPLHWWRHWRRGYNQAEALAEGVAKRLKLPVRRLLKRVVGTRRLADLSRTARGEVVRGAFRVRCLFQADRAHCSSCG